MSNRDRGTIKWDSIMLPEHVEMLKDLFAEDDHKERPILDEQQIMEINATLQHALRDDLTVRIKYFHDRGEYTIKGKLLSADVLNGYLIVDDGDMTRIALGDLVQTIII